MSGTDILGFILIFGAIIGYLLYKSISGYQREKKITELLVERGYDANVNRKSATNQELKLEAKYEEFKKPKGKRYAYYYRIGLKGEVGEIISFKISERGFFSKATNSNKGTLPGVKDYNVETNNPQLMGDMFSKPEITAGLKKLFRQAMKFEGSINTDKELNIQVETQRSVGAAITAIDVSQQIISYFR